MKINNILRKLLISVLSFGLMATTATVKFAEEVQALEPNVTLGDPDYQYPSRNLEGAYWYNGVVAHEEGEYGVRG